MVTNNGTTTTSLSTTTAGNASNLGLYFRPFASKPVSQTIPIIPKPPVPEGVAMPPNRSPAKILSKIRSNSTTTQLQAEKQASYCVEEFINGTASHENAMAAPLKARWTSGLSRLSPALRRRAASEETTATTPIAPTNSTLSPAPPKPKASTTKAKKHKQAKNRTDGKASTPTRLAYSDNKYSATQIKATAPITSTKCTTPTVPTTPTTPTEPIKPPKPPKTKTESKATGPSKATAGSKKFNLTKDKNGSSTSTPAKSTPGSRTATSAKRASGPKTSKLIESVQASRKVSWFLGALPF